MMELDIERRLQALSRPGINLDLAPIKGVLEKLNNPQESYPSIIVGGTNGKGSVCAALSSILQQAGYRVGLYTSPHLVDVRERIKVGNRLITAPELLSLLEKIVTAGGGQLTYFEMLTAIAFEYFRARRIDIAVLEVGMGGRLDATNVVTPLVSVVTNVSRDHCPYLGTRLVQIAREKAGIIKKGGICLTGVEQRAVREEIARICEENSARLYALGRDFRVRRRGRDACFDYYGLRENLLRLSFGLHGPHQIRNAALAVGTWEVLSGAGFEISEAHLRRGLAQVRWEGRLEEVAAHPLTLLDGAHNPAGIRALCRALEGNYPGRRFFFVFGCLADKDYLAMLRHLNRLASSIILTQPPTSRSRAAAEMASFFPGRVSVEEDPVSAFEKARKLAGENDIVCVTGSLYLVGAIKSYLRKSGFSDDK